MKITKITAAVLSAAMAVSLCACGNNASEQSSGGSAVITVGSKTMTAEELEAYVKGYTMGGLDFDTAKEYAVNDATDILSTEALFDAMGLSYTDEEKAANEKEKESVIGNFGGEDGYKEYLDSMGITDEFVDRMLNSNHAQEKIFADEVSDEKVRQNFEDNYLRAKHILISTMDTSTQEKYDDAKIAEQKAKADELLKRAQGGEDFDALVKEYSEDPGSQSNPDGYYFTAGEMVPEFEDTTRSLGMDEIGMCESTYGYHIIKRLPLEDDEESLTKIRQNLLQTAVEDKMPALLEENGLTVEKDQAAIDAIKDEEDNNE